MLIGALTSRIDVLADGHAIGLERAVPADPGRPDVADRAIGRNELDPSPRDGAATLDDDASDAGGGKSFGPELLAEPGASKPSRSRRG